MSNRKTGKKQKSEGGIMAVFILVIIGSVFAGYIVGSGGFKLVHTEGFDEIVQNIIGLIEKIVPVICVLFSVVLVLLSGGMLKKTQKKIKSWDGEDEDMIEEIETELNYPLLCSNILMIGCLFFFSALMKLFMDGGEWCFREPGILLLALTMLVFDVAYAVIIQKKIVDMEKTLNPEKKGNILDFNFQKEWENSSDEAQKLMIYKAGYAAYKTACAVCTLLWIITFSAALLFQVGFLACFCMIIIWLTLVISFSVAGIKLEKRNK